ncbi:hypothetical Protein YC6258_00277 [Gynuella sunshinyii YC6258]|uniref:Uncharacterized protein n=1 Tax=Gynuella sunshinyii YC6258 TaxID=1445510 RepID=A0A0C5VDQ2_9GAMM|nr:hypothetical Protein YC6258_00277 [Gynuella sunshinyii YC6258]
MGMRYSTAIRLLIFEPPFQWEKGVDNTFFQTIADMEI